MVSDFPLPYPDELFYSLVARFKERMNFPSQRSVNKVLYGKEYSSRLLDTPYYFAVLEKNLPLGYPLSIQDLINQHTLERYYAFDLGADKTEIYLNNIKYFGSSRNREIGRSLIKKPHFLRSCPQCSTEDIQQYGETYWHRIHQLPGVYVCLKHQTFLVNSNIDYLDTPRTYVSARAVYSSEVNPVPDFLTKFLHHLLDIANQSWSVLEGNYLPLKAGDLRQRIVERIFEQGYIVNSVIDSDLENKIRNYFSDELLNFLDCSLQDPYNWLSSIMVNRSNHSYPLHYILLLIFLKSTALKLTTRKNTNLLFGDVAYPCMNKFCPDYNQFVIKNWKFLGVFNLQVQAAFVCEYCGFTFSRFADQHPLAYNTIIDYGDFWRTKLQLLIAEGLSLTNLAQKMHTTADRVVLEAYNWNIKLPFMSFEDAESIKPPKKIDKFQRKAIYRKIWLLALSENKELDDDKFTAIYGTVIGYLRLFDFEWFLSTIDSWLKDKVVEIAKSITIDSSLKLTSLKLISKQINQFPATFLDANLKYLPNTYEALLPYLEGYFEYVRSKLKIVTNGFIERQIVPSKRRFIRVAKVLRAIQNFPWVDKEIDQLLEEIRTHVSLSNKIRKPAFRKMRVRSKRSH